MKQLALRYKRTLQLLLFFAINLIFTGVIALGAFLYAWTAYARGLPPLQGWHLQAPESEFTASDATDAFNLDSYLALEERVFAELGILIDTQWQNQATELLNRYRADSICNPERILDRNWNRSRILAAPDPVAGVLLVHGLSDSPYSLRALGERLHAEGYTVVWLRVPGHGTCPKALADVSWRDWTAAVRVAARGLRDRLPRSAPMVLAGFSNGGSLCLEYATAAIDDPMLPPADAVVLFSPMIGITPLARLSRLNGVIAWLSGQPKARWSSIHAPVQPFKYSSWPMNASVQAREMTQRVEERLASLEASDRTGELPPILAIQSAVDSTVIVPHLITTIFDRLKPGPSELVLFDVNRAQWLAGLIDLRFEEQVVPRLTRPDMPFTLTVVTNAAPDSRSVVALTRKGEQRLKTELDMAWPQDVFSLSHVAVPISPSDPILGTADATQATGLPLGTLNLSAETGVLRISSDLLIRQQYNPFYPYMENRVVDWLNETLHKTLAPSHER